MKQIFKFFALKAKDRYLLLKTFILLRLVRLGLWLLPFGKLRKLLARINQLLSANSEAREQIELNTIIWAINVNSHYCLGTVKCLARALTTQVLMNHYGYSPQLKIGVAKSSSNNLEAHAWVESQNQVIIGHLPDLSRFIPLPSLEEGL